MSRALLPPHAQSQSQRPSYVVSAAPPQIDLRPLSNWPFVRPLMPIQSISPKYFLRTVMKSLSLSPPVSEPHLKILRLGCESIVSCSIPKLSALGPLVCVDRLIQGTVPNVNAPSDCKFFKHACGRDTHRHREENRMMGEVV